MPPFTSSVMPVQYADSSLARNTQAPATSEAILSAITAVKAAG